MAPDGVAAALVATVRCDETAFPAPVERSVDSGAAADVTVGADATVGAPAEVLFAEKDDAVPRVAAAEAAEATRGAGTTSPDGENANLEMLFAARTSVDVEEGDDCAAVSDDAAAAPFPETGVDPSESMPVGLGTVGHALKAAIFVIVAGRDAGADASDELAVGALLAKFAATATDGSELAAGALTAVGEGLEVPQNLLSRPSRGLAATTPTSTRRRRLRQLRSALRSRL